MSVMGSKMSMSVNSIYGTHTQYFAQTVKDDKKEKQDEPKNDQKDEKTAAAESGTGIKNTVIDRTSIKKGMLVKVTVKAKDDGTLTAREVLLIADAKE